MKVISLARTKELLGITDTASDAKITAKIPFIDALVKRITKNRFNLKIYGNATLNSPITYDGVDYLYQPSTRKFVSGINNYFCVDDLADYLEIGQLIEGTGIPADTHIDEVYYNGTAFNDGTDDFALPTIKLSNNATATSEDGFVYVGINIAYQMTIANGIQYLINGTNTSLPSNSLSSRSLGPSSKSFSTADQKIDNKYGMPAWFVKAFPKYMRGH
jgi:hypothetical protein